MRLLKGYILSLVILSSVISGSYAANGILPGEGTITNPYLIEDYQDFVAFSDIDNAFKYCSAGVNVSLMTDLDLDPQLPGREVYSESVVQGSLHGIIIGPIISDPVIIYPDIVNLNQDCVENSFDIYETVLDEPDYGVISSSIFEIVRLNKFESGYAYAGTFWGNGHKIKNLTIYNNTEHSNGCGLFSTILDTGAVYDLSLIDISISGKFNYAGGICSVNEGVIDNCVIKGEIVSEFQCHSFGGVAGDNFGTISNCVSYASVLSFAYAGGICGKNAGLITSCSSQGSIMATEAAGGIAGSNGAVSISDYEGHILNCYSTASVDEVILDYWYLAEPELEGFYDGTYVAGIYASICGVNLQGSIANCYGNDIITSKICDVCDVSNDIYNCFWNNDSNVKPEYADEMWVSKSEMLVTDTFIAAGWDESVWMLNAGSMPELFNIYLKDVGIVGIEIDSDSDVLFAGDSITASIVYNNGMKMHGKNVYWSIVDGSDNLEIFDGRIEQLNFFFDPVVIEFRATTYDAGEYYTASEQFTVYPYGWKTDSSITSMHIYASSVGVPDQWISFTVEGIDLGQNEISSIGVKLADYSGSIVASKSALSLGSGENTFAYNAANHTLEANIKGTYDFIGIEYPLIVNISGAGFSKTCFAFDEEVVFQMPDGMNDASFDDVVIYRQETPGNDTDMNWKSDSNLTILVDNFIDYCSSVPLQVIFTNENGEMVDVTGSVEFTVGIGGEYGYFDNGMLYNENESNIPNTIFIACKYILDGTEYRTWKSAHLLPDYQSTQLNIRNVTVKASSNRSKPKDRLEMEIRDFIIPTSYPKYTQWAIDVNSKEFVVSRELTIAIEDKNGIAVNGFPRTYQCDEYIRNYMIDDMKVYSSKDEKFEFRFANNAAAQINGYLNISLKNQNLTGLSAPFKVIISSDNPVSGFKAEGFAYDSSLSVNVDGQNKRYSDVINKDKNMPCILLNGREDSVFVSQIKNKIGKGSNSDSLKISGTFTVADIDNFDPKLLYIKYGSHEDYSDKITKVKNGYVVKEKVYIDDIHSEIPGKQKKIFDLYAMFNMKTMKFNIRIKNVNAPYKLDDEEFSFQFIDADINDVIDNNFTVIYTAD